MPSILDLPNEVLHLVGVSHEAARRAGTWDPLHCLARRDFAALARTCRRFYHVFGPILYTQNRDWDGSLAVYLAVQLRSLATLRRAAEFGLDLDQRPTPYGLSDQRPCQEAIKLGYDDILEWLLDHGVPMDDPRGGDSRSLDHTPWSPSPSPLPSKPLAESFTSALATAIDAKREAMCIALIERGACLCWAPAAGDDAAASERSYADPEDALHFAAKSGLARVVEELVVSERRQVDAVDSNGYTALMWAACTPLREPMVAKLCGLGADPNFRNGEGRTPLNLAIYTSNAGNAAALLAAGARIEPPLGPRPSSGDEAPAIFYCLENWVESASARTILELLVRAGADVHSAWPETGLSPLETAMGHASSEAVRVLLGAGARIDAAGPGGPALLDAAWSSFVAFENPDVYAKVRLLLEAGVRIDVPNGGDGGGGRSFLEQVIDEFFHTDFSDPLVALLGMARSRNLSRAHVNLALDVWVGKRSAQVCTVLRHHGAQVTDEDALVRWAAEHMTQKHYSLVYDAWPDADPDFTFLLDYGMRDENLELILCSALSDHRDWHIHQLLDRRVPSRMSSPAKRTCLYKVVKWGHIPVLRRFLQFGVDLNALYEDGDTLLMVALRNQHDDVVGLLLDEGADPFLSCSRADSAASPAPMSAFQLAIQLGKYEFAKLFLEEDMTHDLTDEDAYFPRVLSNGYMLQSCIAAHRLKIEAARDTSDPMQLNCDIRQHPGEASTAI